MKYNQRDTGQLHTRAFTIVINHPHASEGLEPSIVFHEQEVLTKDGVETPINGLLTTARDTLRPDNIDEEFQLIDMTTNEVIEGASGTYGQFATMLYSLYFHVAEKRDSFEYEVDMLPEKSPEEIAEETPEAPPAGE